MATRRSAGLLLHRTSGSGVTEVLLVHPGGPFWARKDVGTWSVPKGEYQTEDPRAAGLREFEEELGIPPPAGEVRELGVVTQRGGKVVTAFCLEADLDLSAFHSNTFEMEWPPRSGVVREFPEVDRAAWLPLADARTKLLAAQVPLLELLAAQLTAQGRHVVEE
jgi:predicted NUDIX family NTP pyrophosphohydrolase